MSLITGTESALGTALADYLYRAGHRVYRLDTSRFFAPSAEDEEGAAPSHESVEAAVSDYVTHVVNREGQLDALVNVAGYGLVGAVETATVDEVHDLYAHNLLLPHAATRAALSVMGVQGRGAVVNVGLFPRRDAQAGHGLFTASLNNLLSYTEALRREFETAGISARFVQARAPEGAYGPGVRWNRLLTLPSLRALRDTLRRSVGAEAAHQAHVQLAHLIEGMIRDPRPAAALLPGHAVPPSARVQVREEPAASGHSDAEDEVPESPVLLEDPAAATGVDEASAPAFAPPAITFVGRWDEPERRLLARAVRGYEAEADGPTLSDAYWICSNGAGEAARLTAHRAGSALLLSAPNVESLARQIRAAGARRPDRPY